MCREGVSYLPIVPCTIESIFLLRTLVEGYTSLRFPWVRVPHNVWSNEYCIHHYWMMLHHSQALPTHSHSCLVVNITHLRLIPELHGNENKRNEYYTMFCGLWYITSQMIYHSGGEPERAMHCWINVMAHKPWNLSPFAVHERGNQGFFFRSVFMKYLNVVI